MPWFNKSSRPIPVTALGLPSIESLAADMLLRAGLDAVEVQRVQSLYPTRTSPNPRHLVNAGDEPNPWTLSSLVAEQLLWNVLNAAISSGRYASVDESSRAYVEGGVDALAGVFASNVKAYDREVDEAAMSQFLYRTFDDPDHPMWGLVIGFVREYWTPGQGLIVPT